MGFLERLLGRKKAARAPVVVHDEFGENLDVHASLVVARWSDAQRAEYLAYGADVLAACLALEDGRFHDADNRFKVLLEEVDAPGFLLYDAARARLLAGHPQEAEKLFLRFLDAREDAATPEQRLEVGVELATIADAEGDVDRAIERLTDLVESRPDDGRAYLALGRYLRAHGFGAEARDVCRGYVGTHADAETAIVEELGLAELAVGNLAGAERCLDEVVARARCTCGARIPEATAVGLASIYESTGRHDKGIELLRTLGRTASGACSS